MMVIKITNAKLNVQLQKPGKNLDCPSIINDGRQMRMFDVAEEDDDEQEGR